MKQDIRDLFKIEGIHKKKLPDSHREEFFKKLEKLETSPSKNRNYGLFFKIAASFILLMAITFLTQKNNKQPSTKAIELVNQPDDSTYINPQKYLQNDAYKNRITLEEKSSNNLNEYQHNSVIIKHNSIKKEQNIIKSQKTIQQPKINQEIQLVTNNVIHPKENNIETILIKSDTAKSNPHKGIKINSDALLYSVTHASNEVLAYYKANNLNRESVLVAIEKDLKKSNLDIDANALLAEIELGIKGYSFKEKLIAKIKIKIKELSNTIVTN